jgi:hypothetical protein
VYTLPRENVNRKPTPKKRVKKKLAQKKLPTPESIGIDLQVFATVNLKLSLKESGELIRALMRAQRAKRPNRDQRMLLAVFTREGDEPCTA